MIDLTYQATLGSVVEASFMTRAEAHGYKHLIRSYYNTTITELPDELLEEVCNSRSYSYSSEYLIEREDGLLSIEISHSGGYVTAYYFGSDRKAGQAHLDGLKEFIPQAQAKDDTASFNFWSMGSNGPSCNYKELKVPGWDEVSANYPEAVATQLEKVIGLETGNEFGKLVLWRGEPGTGKTYALRALARSWKKWCKFQYITDPETFFGQASYMMHVIGTADAEKWNLLILEDSGELLSPDAKSRTGQGLSRLLNLVDGILGQGLKLMVLITTNEELSSMHPAVIRSGRCSSNLEFESFPYYEANDWWKAQKCDVRRPTGYYSLAKMYALMRGDEVENDRKAPIGFAA